MEDKKEVSTKEIILNEIKKLSGINDELISKDNRKIEDIKEIRENVVVITQLLNQVEMRNKI